MTDDIARNALARDITSRLISCSHDELRVFDRLLLRTEFVVQLPWKRRIATGPGDADRRYHLASKCGGSMVTRCEGRWPAGDAVETFVVRAQLFDLCRACMTWWFTTENIAEAIVDAITELADEDRRYADLREAARLEMLDGGA